uniref:MFS domain-containing protein n=1 Tax=Rhabditophanes sp. KR3021 TaxID=114890 RepID=A0AC35U9U1_9BILA
MTNQVIPSADDRIAQYAAHDKASRVKAVFNQSRESVKNIARGTAHKVSRVLSSGKAHNIEQLVSSDEPASMWFFQKKRWQIAIMANIGFMIAFGVRTNFGAAKTRMINNFTDPLGVSHPQQFFWTSTQLGFLESSFFYGYAVSQIPGGLLAAKYAPNWLFGLSIAIASALNLVIPVALNYHPTSDYLTVALQIAQGLSLGVAYPAMHGLWRFWAPPLERSKLCTTTFMGSYLGVALGMPLSASLVSYVNWSSPFYFYGVVGVVWIFGWWRISSATPKHHKHITEAERNYITSAIGPVASSGQVTLTTVPWKAIVMSGPVWSIVVCNFCRSWSFFLLLGNQLTYMSDVLNMQIHNGGLYSALPQFALAACVFCAGQSSDWLRSTGKLSTTAVRKLYNSIGFGMEAIFLCILAFVTSPPLAIIILTASSGLSGFALAGFNVNHFDIAPRYAPILMGFSNGIGALAGLVSLVVEHLTKNNPAGWRELFLIAVGVDLFGFLFFNIFSSGELQEWAKEEEPTQSYGEIIRKVSTAVRRMSTISRRGAATTNTNARTRVQKLRAEGQTGTNLDGISNFGASFGSVSMAHPVVTLPEGEELEEVEQNTFMMSNASILNDNRNAAHFI